MILKNSILLISLLVSVYNLRKQITEVETEKDKINIFVLYEAPTCTNCFKDLNKFFESYESKEHINLIGLINCQDNITVKKQSVNDLKEFIKIDEYYFDDEKKPLNFELINSNYTPSLIIDNGDIVKKISHNNLFKNGKFHYKFLKKELDKIIKT